MKNKIRMVVKDKNGKEIGDVSFNRKDGYWETLHYESDIGYYGAETKEDAVKEVRDLHNDFISNIKEEYNKWKKLYNRWIIIPKG